MKNFLSLLNNDRHISETLFSEDLFRNGFMNPWREDGNVLTLEVDIPGVPKESINILNRNGMLEISAERVFKNKTSQYAQKYKSTYSIPKNVKWDSLEAKLDNGVLTIKMNKEDHLEKKIEIK